MSNYQDEYKARMRGDYSSRPTDTAGLMGRAAADAQMKQDKERRAATAGPGWGELVGQMSVSRTQAIIYSVLAAVLLPLGYYLFDVVGGDVKSWGGVALMAGLGCAFVAVIQIIKLGAVNRGPAMIIGGSVLIGLALGGVVGLVLAPTLAALFLFFRRQR